MVISRVVKKFISILFFPKKNIYLQVISYTWKSNPGSNQTRQFEGLKKNLVLAESLYPEFTVRLYHDLTNKDKSLDDVCSLACAHDALDLCNIKEVSGHSVARRARKDLRPSEWKYLPTKDQQVQIVPL